jgi:hypothetical protein
MNAFLSGCFGAAFGLVWALVGIWLSAIPTGVLQTCIMVICAALFAWDLARNWTRVCISYVCADGFGVVSTTLSGSGKYLSQFRTREARFNLKQVDIECEHHNEAELALNVDDGRISRIVKLHRVLLGMDEEQWKRWIAAIRDAIEESRWSESLNFLARLAPKSRDLPVETKATLAVPFEVLSVLHSPTKVAAGGERDSKGMLGRLPTGRIGFLEDGLVVANLVPLYEALTKIDSLASGIQLANQVGVASTDTTAVGQAVERWRTEHVLIFPVAAIEEVKEDHQHFIIRLRSGKSFEFQLAQVIGCSTLLRLIRSEIWHRGIEAALRSQMKDDISRMHDCACETFHAESIFGRCLPTHRSLVWDAAYRLRVTTWKPGERADERTRRAFQDSQRIRPGRTHSNDYFLDVFLGWEECNGEVTPNETKLSVAPESEAHQERVNDRSGSAPE